MKINAGHIAQLLNQDRKAQYELYKQCFAYMKSITLRYQREKSDVDDVINRAFLKVLKSIDKYDVSKSFAPWLARITVNENIDACRRGKSLRKLMDFDSETVDADINNNYSEYNVAAEQLDAEGLRCMINQLPDATREVFNLYVIDGYKHHEIAEMMGFTTSTSKWHLNSARKRLKTMITKLNETEKIIHYGE